MVVLFNSENATQEAGNVGRASAGLWGGTLDLVIFHSMPCNVF